MSDFNADIERAMSKSTSSKAKRIRRCYDSIIQHLACAVIIKRVTQVGE